MPSPSVGGSSFDCFEGPSTTPPQADGQSQESAATRTAMRRTIEEAMSTSLDRITYYIRKTVFLSVLMESIQNCPCDARAILGRPFYARGATRGGCPYRRVRQSRFVRA